MSASQQWKFSYSVPPPPEGKLVELSFAELEGVLLKNLEAAGNNPMDPMWQLARFYSHSRQQEKALHYLRKILVLQPDTEHKSATVLAMGQTMEQVGDYESATRYYREAFAFEPVHTRTWYFINNNLGFSLNMLGKFDEAVQFCRAAIAIDRQRPNAFKNLGIALRGQRQWTEAATCFVQATQVDASDARSMKLLEELLGERTELELEFRSHLECCRRAVEMSRQRRASLSSQPVICRGWRKQLLLLRIGVASWWKRMWKRN